MFRHLYAYLGCNKPFDAVQITKVDYQTTTRPAPALYNLTDLQREADLLYVFPATKTLEITRRLYEDKLISHPLTDSRRIPSDVFEVLPKIRRHDGSFCPEKGPSPD
jgi:DNA topoisomerase IA